MMSFFKKKPTAIVIRSTNKEWESLQSRYATMLKELYLELRATRFVNFSKGGTHHLRYARKLGIDFLKERSATPNDKITVEHLHLLAYILEEIRTASQPDESVDLYFF